MDTHILIANDLSKRYGQKSALNSLNLFLRNNEVVGLLGPNGAGKSTCFAILAGLIKPDSGRIVVDSIDITGLAMHLRSKSGLTYLPQEPSVFKELSTDAVIPY